MNVKHWTTCALLLLLPASLQAGEVSVAVAANFSAPMKVIAEQFQVATGHRAILSFGSSGKFYAQIKNGAPYQVFLSADQAKPQALANDGMVVSGSRFTYALGALALWSADKNLIDESAAVLKTGNFRKLAIANPRLAPYGNAALETLDALGLRTALSASLVRGENIAQAYQFVGSGNAELGFVALSQVWQDGEIRQGSGWKVPGDLHSPIRQDAVLLLKGRRSAAAGALLAFLKSEQARDVIKRFGYRTPERQG